jgi:hypothetical protein
MTPKRSALALVLALYFVAGGVCLSEPEPTPQPGGQPTPEARWAKIIQRDDPRPFLIRLLLSIRYDFYHRDVRGGADF